MKIENLINVIRCLREQGYNSVGVHVEFNPTLNEALINNLSKLRYSKEIDFNDESLWEAIEKKNIGDKVNIDFVITSECKLIIYSSLSSFLESKKSIRNDLSFIEEFYLFEEDCYYNNNFDNNEIRENIEKLILVTKFINNLFVRSNKDDTLKSKLFIKEKSIDLTFSYTGYQHAKSLNIDIIKEFNGIKFDSYKIEKEQILRNSIYNIINDSVCIDEIIQEWENILTLYEDKLKELIDYYYIEEKESKLYKAKIEAMQAANTLLSELITKSLSIPLILGVVATIKEYSKDKWTILISIIGVLFTSIIIFLSISEQDKSAKSIISDYKSMTKKKSFSRKLNKKIVESQREIDEKIDKLFKIISLIKAGISTSVIIVLFMVGIQLLN